MLVMEGQPVGRDARFAMGYNMLGEEMFSRGIPGLSSRGPASALQSGVPCATSHLPSRGVKRPSSEVCFDTTTPGGAPSPLTINTDLSSPQESAGGADDLGYTNVVHGGNKKTPPPNGKKTKGRVKIKMEYIDNKLRRYTTFSKRKTGIMKKAYELSTLTGTQVMLLVASETGHVYTFATRKLQPMITSEAGKALIQTCLNSPDPAPSSAGGDQRMSATGFEETELTYNISDEEQKEDGGSSQSDGENSGNDVEESLSGGESQGEDAMACDEDISPGGHLTYSGYRRAMQPNNRTLYATSSAHPNEVIFSLNAQVDPGGLNGSQGASRSGVGGNQRQQQQQQQQQYINLPFQLSVASSGVSQSGKDDTSGAADLSRSRK